MMASATDADARRKRGRMPAAASDQASNEADPSVPPSRFVASDLRKSGVNLKRQ